MGRYRKIDTRIWNDAKFRQLSDDAQFIFIYCLTHPHMTSLGAMRATGNGLAMEKGWGVDRFSAAFDEIARTGMILVDEEAACIAVPNFLKYNPPESPNVIRGAWKECLDLIPECELQYNAIQAARAFAESKGKAFVEAFREAFPQAFPEGYPLPFPEGCPEAPSAVPDHPSPHPSPNQEQEQEQEPEQEQEKAGSSERLPASGGSHSKPASAPEERKKHSRKNTRPGTHGAGPTVLTIPLVGGIEAPVTEDFVGEMEKLFPGVDVRREFNKIRAYFIGKPRKRKTAAGIAHCITTWLGKEQDRGKAPAPASPFRRNDHPSAPVPARTTDIRDVMIDGKLMREEYDIATGAVLKTFPHPSTRKRA
jgi:hypothetical protein